MRGRESSKLRVAEDYLKAVGAKISKIVNEIFTQFPQMAPIVVT